MADATTINWNGPQPAPRHLAKRLRVNFPEITQTGIYNDRNVAGTQKKSAHAEGRALDIHLNAANPEHLTLGNQLFLAITRKASLIGVDNIIWNREIWSQAHPFVRPYSGASPHTDHIHVEFTRAGSQHNVLTAIELDIAIIRTGMEDLRKGRENIL